MRKMLAVLVVLCCCGSAFAANFPEIGICTGERVRLRASPGMKGKFLGFVEPDRNRFVILGEVHADGLKWYKLDHPTARDTAYIAGQYVKILPVSEAFAEVRLTFGISPEKTRAICGAPTSEGSEFLDYSERYYLWYDKNGLRMADIHENGRKEIAGIRLGDDAEKLSALGMPASELTVSAGEEYPLPYGCWVYMDKASGEQIVFHFIGRTAKDAVIDSMTWSRPTH